jgi:hypothetical protein
LGEVQRVDEQARVFGLPTGAGAHEAPKLPLVGPSLLRRLLLEDAERSKLTLTVEDLFYGGGTEGADQLVLQVRDADVETESFRIGASEARAETGPLETALEIALLGGVTEARKSDVKPVGAEYVQEASDVSRTANWDNGSALSVKILPTAIS